MTSSTNPDTQGILDQLNNYEESHKDPNNSNIWQDVIGLLPLDDEATDAVDGSNDRFVLADGREFAYAHEAHQWIAKGTRTRPE